jgi:hypothetical protein
MLQPANRVSPLDSGSNEGPCMTFRLAKTRLAAFFGAGEIAEHKVV